MIQAYTAALTAIMAGAFFFSFASPAIAVIVDGPDGTGTNNTTSFPQTGMDNFGLITTSPASSAVYLGNGWVLTAAHPTGGASYYGSGPALGNIFTTGGLFYTATGNYRTFTNSDGTTADLVAFQIAANSTTGQLPPQGPVTLAAQSPTVPTNLYTVGFGQVTTSSFGPITGTGGEHYQGYTISSNQYTTRWGMDMTADPGGGAIQPVTISGFSYVSMDFFSEFQPTGSGTSTLISAGDSGGPVFNSSNQLMGINEGTIPLADQPDNTALYGDYSAYIDIAPYESQIAALVPEPGSLGLLAACAAPLLLRRRRSRFAPDPSCAASPRRGVS